MGTAIILALGFILCMACVAYLVGSNGTGRWF